MVRSGSPAEIDSPSPRSRRWLAIVLFTLGLVSYGYFFQGRGPNQSSRFDLTRAVVEQHTFRIDRYHGNTFDKAFAEGHFYSDKAPGLSLAAVPAYALWRVASRDPGIAEDDPGLWATTTATVGALSALAMALAFLLLVREGFTTRTALLVAVTFGLGTPAFIYSTTFFAHQLVASLLLIALFLVRAERSDESRRGTAGRLALVGFLAGWAAISEFPALGAALALGLFISRRDRPLRAVWFASGASVPLGLLAFYNAVCFGSPLRLGYSQLANDFFQGQMAAGLFGIHLPRPAVALELLFGEYRGLLPLSPVLALSALGFWLAFRSPARRRLALLCFAVFAYFVALVAGYFRWDGGAAIGPRHLVPALPFLLIPTAEGVAALVSWRGRLRHVGTALVGVLALWSIAICTVATSVALELPEEAVDSFPVLEGMEWVDPRHPLTTLVLPLFARDRVSEAAVDGAGRIGLVATLGPEHEWDAFNLGEKLGLRGRASLLPLLAFWIALAASAAAAPRGWEPEGEPAEGFEHASR